MWTSPSLLLIIKRIDLHIQSAHLCHGMISVCHPEAIPGRPAQSQFKNATGSKRQSAVTQFAPQQSFCFLRVAVLSTWRDSAESADSFQDATEGNSKIYENKLHLGSTRSPAVSLRYRNKEQLLVPHFLKISSHLSDGNQGALWFPFSSNVECIFFI